jgi:hypothetical protein
MNGQVEAEPGDEDIQPPVEIMRFAQAIHTLASEMAGKEKAPTRKMET